ncbi:hypothetical protein ACFVJ5_07460 [Nocardia sp. NPDC127606]|uniref:hypothetical protein n=1 Tax=Nocardia sp. NPDC127606 TaxID=3345406 RepID=UPI003645A9F4
MDEALWEAARSVRSYLDELVGPEAPDLDAALCELLSDPHRGEHREYQLRMIFESHEGTRVFLERVREDFPEFRPPQVLAGSTTRSSGLPGDALPVGADKFTCPHGDYVWYRPEVGAAVPLCPTHGALRLT